MFNRPPGLLGGTPNQFSMLGYSPMARPGMGGGGMLGGGMGGGMGTPMAPQMGGGTPMPAYQPQRFAPPSIAGTGKISIAKPGSGAQTFPPNVINSIPSSRGGGMQGINGQTPPSGWIPVSHEDGTIFHYLNPENPWERWVGSGGGGGGGSGNLYMGGGGPGGTAGDDGGVGAAADAGPGPDGPGPGFAMGGRVTEGRLAGPNPPGPDDGHAALDEGEFVIRASQAKKHRGLLSAINSGASKKQIRGLLG